MINLDKFKNAGEKTTLKLHEICTQLGVKPVDFSISSTTIQLTRQEVLNIINKNPNKPFTNDNGDVIMLYIRDHLHDKNYENCRHPNNCYHWGKKIHFYPCATMTSMEDMGRKERYDSPRQITDKQSIDLPPVRNPRTIPVRLAFCRNCIGHLINEVPQRERKWGNKWGNTGENRRMVAEYADVVELMDCVQLWSESALDFRVRLKIFLEQTIKRAYSIQRTRGHLRKGRI